MVHWHNGSKVQWREDNIQKDRKTARPYLLPYNLLDKIYKLNPAFHIRFYIYPVGMIFYCLQTDK